MIFDKMTGILKFGHKEYPNIHMEVIPSVRVWRRKHHRLCLNSRSIMAHCKVDVMFISLIDEPLAQFPHAFVCFIRGISLDAFESQWTIPIVGWKDVVRCSEQCHIWWMDGLWPEFYTVIWESAVDVDVIWRPSIGSSLRGWPHGVSVLKLWLFGRHPRDPKLVMIEPLHPRALRPKSLFRLQFIASW